MKVGVQLGNLGTFGDDPGVEGCIGLAEAAEALGYDSVWVSDHIVLPSEVRSRYPYNESGMANFATGRRIFEPLTVLAAVAARTQRIALGTGVLIVPYRNPLLLAGVLSTIDHLSRGRLVLGIGVGWLQEEFEALGLGGLFEQRGGVTDEWVGILRHMWTQEGPAGFEGRFHRFEAVQPSARAFQQPHPKIWIGGKTEAALRRVARYGDGFISISSTPAELRAQLAHVRQGLEAAGRAADGIDVAISGGGMVAESPDELIDRLREYTDAGLTHLTGVPAVGRRSAPASDAGRLAQQLENLHYFAQEIRPALP